MPDSRPFSIKWLVASIVAFIGTELVIGGLLGELLLGRTLSINTSFLLRGMLNLIAFIVGGFIIGFVSPGRRLAEPAAAGFVTIFLTALVAIFVPFRYVGYTGGRMFAAGIAAAIFAVGGAYFGEKLTGNVK